MLSIYRTFLLKWTARTGTVICVTALGAVYLGEGFGPLQPAGDEWIRLLLFPGGLVVGLVLGWRWEGIGSLIALGSLAAFYIVYPAWLTGGPWQWAAFGAFAVPAFLYLADWLLSILPTVRRDHPVRPR